MYGITFLLVFLTQPSSVVGHSMLSPFLAHQPPPHWKSQIARRSFGYASPRLWNQLPDAFRQPRQSCLDWPEESFTYQPLSSSPLSSSITLFTPGSKPTFSTNPSNLITSNYFNPWTAFMIMGPNWTYHASRFIFSSFFSFNFSVCPAWWTKPDTRQAFYHMLNAPSDCIISYELFETQCLQVGNWTYSRTFNVKELWIFTKDFQRLWNNLLKCHDQKRSY